MRPELSRIPTFYHGYVNLVEENDILTAFNNQTNNLLSFLASIPANKHEYRYAEGKWTIAEMLQHIIDAERVFSYRALVFARKDKTSLPAFDENAYAENSNAAMRNWFDMVEEFRYLRLSNEKMFQSFNEQQLESVGTANNNSISVKAIGYVIVGHAKHHVAVLNDRYLKEE